MQAGYTTEAFRAANREFYRAKLELAKTAVEGLTPILRLLTKFINVINALPKGIGKWIITIFLGATAIAVILTPLALMTGYLIALVLLLQRWGVWSRIAAFGSLKFGAANTAAAAGTNLLTRSLLFLQVSGGPILLVLGAIALVAWEIARAFRAGADATDDLSSAQSRAAKADEARRGNTDAFQSTTPGSGDVVTPGSGAAGRRPKSRPWWQPGGNPIDWLTQPRSAPKVPGVLDLVLPHLGLGNLSLPSGLSSAPGGGTRINSVSVTVNTRATDPMKVADVVENRIRAGFKTGKYAQDMA